MYLPSHSNQTILFFDGVCNLCNSAIQFVIRHDKQGKVKFATLQSKKGIAAKAVLKAKLGRDPDSLILFHNNQWYAESDAVLQLAGLLDGGWKVLKVLLILPRRVRNWVYQIVARNRYRWFGAKNECMMPTASLKQRFIESSE